MKAHLFGVRKYDRAWIYLSPPSWDCGWYWGFGYLGNAREHCHLDGYADGRNINMYDALMQDYELNETLLGEPDSFGHYPRLWKFCELVLTAYTLKKAAEVLGRGGSHMTTNLCKELIINKEEVKRINEEVLPAIFMEIDNLFRKES